MEPKTDREFLLELRDTLQAKKIANAVDFQWLSKKAIENPKEMGIDTLGRAVTVVQQAQTKKEGIVTMKDLVGIIDNMLEAEKGGKLGDFWSDELLK